MSDTKLIKIKVVVTSYVNLPTGKVVPVIMARPETDGFYIYYRGNNLFARLNRVSHLNEYRLAFLRIFRHA